MKSQKKRCLTLFVQRINVYEDLSFEIDVEKKNIFNQLKI